MPMQRPYQSPVGALSLIEMQYLPGVQLAHTDMPVLAQNAPAGDAICAPTAGGQ
jgi:hypothetical protein